ncbi:hypothetical protein RF11_11039 [Thelohanellus kitauei]|uniref:Uncharacterized protein n=1 Tax=Thelohanellus kitauei TaxID=669202 RepID=A0A0C2MQ57_THEKT|nr:hypothetical protein RF11_11039 [Thelohanellus kitauei]
MSTIRKFRSDMFLPDYFLSSYCQVDYFRSIVNLSDPVLMDFDVEVRGRLKSNTLYVKFKSAKEMMNFCMTYEGKTEIIQKTNHIYFRTSFSSISFLNRDDHCIVTNNIIVKPSQNSIPYYDLHSYFHPIIPKLIVSKGDHYKVYLNSLEERLQVIFKKEYRFMDLYVEHFPFYKKYFWKRSTNGLLVKGFPQTVTVAERKSFLSKYPHHYLNVDIYKNEIFVSDESAYMQLIQEPLFYAQPQIDLDGVQMFLRDNEIPNKEVRQARDSFYIKFDPCMLKKFQFLNMSEYKGLRIFVDVFNSPKIWADDYRFARSIVNRIVAVSNPMSINKEHKSYSNSFDGSLNSHLLRNKICISGKTMTIFPAEQKAKIVDCVKPPRCSILLFD